MAKKTGTIIEDEGELGAASEYVRKTNAEIRELALGCRSGTVFGSWMIHESDVQLLPNIFMPILFMTDIQRKALLRDEVIHFYGQMADASPRAINGMPIFFAMSMLNREDCSRLTAALKALEAFMADDEEGA